MSKQRIEAMLPDACEAIRKCGLAQNGRVEKTLRGQISAFGAAVTLGSLLSAVAFFSQKGGASTERQLLMKAIHYLIAPAKQKAAVTETSLLDMLVSTEKPDAYRECIIDAAIAVKLAMNLFDLGKGSKASETEGA